MSQPRPVKKDSTELTTRRCTQRSFLLNPETVVNQILLYVLAIIADRYDVAVHAVCVMSSHIHSELTDVEGRIPKFFQDAHSLIARAVNAYYGRSENLFAGGKQTGRVELLDEEAALDKLVYIYTNPVAAGLVRHWGDWPGVVTPLCYRDLTIRVCKPDFFFRAKRWPEFVTLKITPPPALAHLSPEELYDRLTERIKIREEEIREEMRREGRSFLGAKRVLKQDPTSRATSEEALFAMQPRVACKDRDRRKEWLRKRKEWLDRHRLAFEAMRDGTTEEVVLFPEGSWKWVVLGGAKVERPPG